MEATENTQTALEKSKSLAEKKFELAIKETTAVVNQCNSIIISDETSLSMAEQALSKANKMMKEADAKRKEILAPAKSFTDTVNEMVKSKITTPLEKAIAHGKAEMKKWNDAEKARKEEADAVNQKIYTYLKRIESDLNNKIKLCNTPESCQKLIDSITEKWPAISVFGQYGGEAIQTRYNFITFLSTRKTALEASISAGDNSVKIVSDMAKEQESAMVKQQEVSAEVDEKKEVLNDSVTISKSKTRKVAKFEVVNFDAVPREFLMIDEAKVREKMSEIKSSMTTKGVIVYGIRFFIDEVPVIS